MIYYGDVLVCKLIKNIGLFKKNFEHIGLCEWTILLPEDMCYKLKIAEASTGTSLGVGLGSPKALKIVQTIAVDLSRLPQSNGKVLFLKTLFALDVGHRSINFN